MKCDNFDKIVLYIDGVLPDETSKDLENHLKECEYCKKIYNTLVSTKEFLSEESIADKNINIKVLNNIDKNRYSKKKNKFRILNKLIASKYIINSAAAVIIICLITFWALIYGTQFNGTTISTTPKPSQNILKPSHNISEPVNILVLGKDNFKSTDTIILVNYDTVNAKLNLLSIPRDTSVDLNGSQTKLNLVYNKGGTELVVNTVNKLLKVNIKYYVILDMDSVKRFMDELDGIDFNVATDMVYDDPLQNIHINLKKGQNHLSGDQIVQFLLYRKSNSKIQINNGSYDGSDFKRIEAQQSMLKELIRQKTNIKYISKIDALADIVLNSSETNLTIPNCIKMLRNISRLNPDEINILTLPGEGGIGENLYYIMDEQASQSIRNEYFNSIYP